MKKQSDFAVITSQKKIWTLNISEIFLYRDLLFLMVRRDFVAFYKQTIFGPLWFFIQPIFTTIIFTFLFNQVAGISTDGLPAVIFYMSGITLWNYFADCLLKTSTVFKDNASVFGKVYFPRLIVPISIVISNLVRFFVQFLLFLVVFIYYCSVGTAEFNFSLYLLLLPVIIMFMALLGLGVGMFISALTTKYRDLSFLVAFGVQLVMYATTVAYPLSAAPEKYKMLIAANPMSVLIESFRYVLMGRGSFDWMQFIVHCIFIIVMFFTGAAVFNRVEKNFMDTV